MVGVEGTQVFLSLTLLLHFIAAATGQSVLRLAVRDGEDVTLPCQNAKQDLDECLVTSWLFAGSGSGSAVVLIDQGKIGKQAGAKSDRLSVTENCSLVLKKVSAGDFGRYVCRQPRKDTHIQLFVVTMTAQTNTEVVALRCSVLIQRQCEHAVKWLYDGHVVEENNDVKISTSLCSVTVRFLTSALEQKPKDREFQCEVTDLYTDRVQQFPLSRQSSGVKPALTTATAPTPTPTPTPATTVNEATTAAAAMAQPAQSGQHGVWRFVVVPLGLAALIITVVAVNVWTRTKGNETRVEENMMHKVEVDGSVNYENLGEHHPASVGLH